METEQRIHIIDKPFDTLTDTTPFGPRYGDEKVLLTVEHLQALQQGKLLAVDVMNEYVLFVALAPSARSGA